MRRKRGEFCRWWMVWHLLLGVSHHHRAAVVMGLTCNLVTAPMYTLYYDSTAQSYSLNASVPVDKGGNRHLRAQGARRSGIVKDDPFERHDAVPSVQLSVRGLQDGSTVSPPPPSSIQARPCLCASAYKYPDHEFFCPAGQDYCYIPRTYADREHLIPSCYNVSRGVAVSKTVWPVVVVWFALLLVCLICTVRGRNAVDCVISSICPCWNPFVLQCMMRRNPDRAVILLRRFYGRNREQIQQRYRDLATVQRLNSASPTTLKLRTRVYSKRSEDRNDDHSGKDDRDVSELEEDMAGTNACTICFAPINEGDRIGDLPCKHGFHVECLKGWLVRRNVCPLCLQSNVATPSSIASLGIGTNDQQVDETQREAASTSGRLR